MADKVKRTKLNLIAEGADYVATVQKECRSWQYDAKKIMTRFNCTHGQALTLITLAQIEDAKHETAKAPTGKGARA